MPDILKDYVKDAFKVAQGKYDSELYAKTKMLDGIPEIVSDRSWFDFVAAILHHNNFLYREPTLENISRYNKLKDLRDKTFNEMFKRYGLLEQ